MPTVDYKKKLALAALEWAFNEKLFRCMRRVRIKMRTFTAPATIDDLSPRCALWRTRYDPNDLYVLLTVCDNVENVE